MRCSRNRDVRAIRRAVQGRSRSPYGPSARYRASQRYAVRSLIPAAWEASLTAHPSLRIRSASSSRVYGVVFALGWSLTWVPLWMSWSLETPFSPEGTRVNNALGTDT